MVCSHAIQYFMPWFRQLSLHPRIDLTVLLGHDHGLHGESFDPGFGRAVRWDIPLTEGIKVEVLRNHARQPGVNRFLGIVNLGLLTALSRQRFDAVVIQGWNYALYPLALLAARLHGLPVLLRGESPLLPGDLSPKDDSSPRGRARRLVLSRYLGLCAGVLAVSSGNRRLLAALGVPPERIFLSPYAVDGERFALPAAERAQARSTWRAELGVAEGVPLLLSVGKLQPVKDPALLLLAYGMLRKEGVRCALGLVGDGELMPALRALAQGMPDVHFLGFRNQSELPALYAAADVFVLPSVRETFGLVVNEAMYAGLPVVCSDGVGCAEDLVRPETGLIFRRGRRGAPPADLAADPDGAAGRLAEKLRKICAGPEAAALRAALGAGGAALIRTWTFEEATAGLLRALATVVDGPEAGPILRSHR